MLARVPHWPASDLVRVREGPVGQSSAVPQGHARPRAGNVASSAFWELIWSAEVPPPTHTFHSVLLRAFFFTQVVHDSVLTVNISGIFQKEEEGSSSPLFLPLSSAGWPLFIVYHPFSLSTFRVFPGVCVHMCTRLCSPHPLWNKWDCLTYVVWQLDFFFHLEVF